MEERREFDQIDRLIKENMKQPEIEDFDPSLVEKEVTFDVSSFDNEEYETSELFTEGDAKEIKEAEPVDISQLVIVEENELEKSKTLAKALNGKKSTFQIVAAQSGYMARVSPLTHKDSVNLLYSNVDQFQYKKTVYQTVWEKIYEASCGKMNFNTWLNATSIEDLETFMYGIYCATFPNEGTFTFNCPNCGEQSEYTINHNNLIKTTDSEKMKKLIQEISKNANSMEAMSKYSLVGKTDAFRLPDSGIVIEYRTPSLADVLDLFRLIPEKTMERKKQSLTMTLYTSRVLIPKEDGKSYITMTDKEEFIKLIDNLSIDDAAILERAMSKKVDENRITYSIKNLTCPHCSKKVGEVAISIEDILFTQIFRRAQ